jgi:hypothetical protein
MRGQYLCLLTFHLTYSSISLTQPSLPVLLRVEARRNRVSLAEAREAKQALQMQSYIGAMQGNVELVAVQTEAMVALCNIVAKGNGIRTLVRTGGLDSIILAMRIHIESVDIQQRGATALSQVACVDPQLRAAVVEANGVLVLAEAMRAHRDMPAVLERSCTALAVVSEGNLECKRSLIQTGALAAIASAMRRHPRRGNLQARGCCALAGVASGDLSCQLDIVNSGGVAAISAAMEMHSGLSDVVAHGATALERVARGGEGCIPSIVRTGGVRCLVSALRWYPTNAHVTHTVASAFAYIGASGGAEPRRELASANATHHLVNALHRHRHRAVVAERGLAALCNLMAGGPLPPPGGGSADEAHDGEGGAGGVSAALRSGGAEFIVDAMGQHPGHARLLLQGCLCLLNAAVESVDSKEVVVNLGGSARLLSVLRANTRDATLVAVACAALANLCAAPETAGGASGAPSPGHGLDEGLLGLDANEEMLPIRLDTHLPAGEMAIGDGGDGGASGAKGVGDTEPPRHTAAARGVGGSGSAGAGAASGAAAGAAAQRPGTSASLSRSRPGTRQGAALLERLEALRLSLLDDGVAAAAVAALSAHKTSAEVVEEGLILLRNLAAGDSAACRDALLANEVANAIVYSMRGHALSARLCVEGCLALRNLACGSPKQLTVLIDGGVVEAIVDALETHGSSEPMVAQAACAALRNLAVDSWGGEHLSRFSEAAGSVCAIVEAGGVEAITRSMRACGESAAVQAHGCGALRNLAVGTLGDPTSRSMVLEAIKSSGGMEAVLSALRGPHGGVRGVQVQGGGALCNLATGPELREDLVDGGAVHVAVAILKDALGGGGGGGGGGGAAMHTEACEQATACLANLTHCPPRSTAASQAAARKAHVSAIDAGVVGACTSALLAVRPSAALVANSCASLIALLDSTAEALSQIRFELAQSAVRGGLIDGLIASCLAFREESCVMEHACACMCKLLRAAPAMVKKALQGKDETFAGKDDTREVAYALQRAKQRGFLREDDNEVYEKLVEMLA